MKVDGWHIDGYGVHADRQVRDLPHGLTIVHGPNESGKTTLQHFLVGMLFGFTPKHRPDHHAPLRGGTYGGRLFVTDATGRPLTISRGAARSSLHLTGPEGELPEGELVQLLGGATRDLYQSIFAVHTEEVAELRALTDDQVRDRVFSAGILGAGRTAQAALDQLADRRDVLFKPNGRGDKYLLKHLRADLVAMRSQLAAAQQAALGLPALVDRLAVLDADAARHAEQADALRAEQALLRAVRDIWALWARATVAREDLAALGPSPELPEGLRQRLHLAEQVRAERAKASAARQEELEAAQASAAALPPIGPIVGHLDDIALLASAAAAEEDRLARLGVIADRIDALEAELDASLRRLGPDCDRAWLAAQPADLEADAALRAIAERVTTARRATHDASAQLATTKRDLGREQAEVDAEATVLATSTAIPVDRARAGLERAVQLRSLAAQREATAQRLSEAAAAASGHPMQPRRADGPLRVALVVAAAASLVGAGLAFGSGAAAAGGFGVATALVLVGLALALPGSRKTAMPPSDQVVGAAVLRAEANRLDQEVATLAGQLGLDHVPSGAEATALATTAERIADEAAERALAQRHLDQRRQALVDRSAHQLAQLRADHEAAEAELAQATADWHAWLRSHALPPTLDAEGAAEHLTVLTQARRLHDDLIREQGEHDRLTTASERFTAATAELAESLPEHLTDVVVPTPVAVVRHLEGEAQRHQELAHQHRAATAEVERASKAARDAADHLDGATQELAEAVAAIGATSLDDAHARLEAADQAAALHATIDQAELALTTAIGTEPARIAQARHLLDHADPDAWERRLQAMDQELAAATAARDAAVQARALAQQEIDHLGRSADVPHLELQVADLEAQLADAVREWAALTVAHQLVEGTLARYQRDRQPQVVQRAATLFAQITDGRYPRLEVRDREITAIDHTGKEIPAAALSRGTVEQLYLCMRFGLAESFAATAPLPILLDDVTINADGERSPRLAQAIATVAANQQVFVFTCHHETVAQLTANDPGARIIELPSSASTATNAAPGKPFGVAG